MSRLDTNDLQERKAELEEASETEAGLTVEEKLELDEIETIEGYCPDFNHGVTLVSESEFEDFAREFVEDIGAIPDDNRWPCTCIDWEAAADELATDYSLVTYLGTDYYVR